MLLMGLFTHSSWMAAIAGLSIIFGAVYMLRLYRNAFYGEVSHHSQKLAAMHSNDFMLVHPLCFLVILLGVYPKLITDISEAASNGLIQMFITGGNGVRVTGIRLRGPDDQIRNDVPLPTTMDYPI